MPSSKGYKRDYKREYQIETPARRHQRAERNKARREYVAAHGVDSVRGRDVDHKQPLSQGGGDALWNLRTLAPHTNRSYPRNPDGSMKDGS